VREEPPPALAAWVNARAGVNGRSIGDAEESSRGADLRFLLCPEHPPCQIDNVRPACGETMSFQHLSGETSRAGCCGQRRAQIVWDSGGIADHHQS